MGKVLQMAEVNVAQIAFPNYVFLILSHRCFLLLQLPGIKAPWGRETSIRHFLMRLAQVPLLKRQQENIGVLKRL